MEYHYKVDRKSNIDSDKKSTAVSKYKYSGI